MGNSIRSRNVARGFEKQSLMEFITDVQTGVEIYCQENPITEQVCIPLRRKSAREFEEDLNEGKLFGLYDVAEALAGPSTSSGRRSAVGPVARRDTDFYGEGNLHYRQGDPAVGVFLGLGYFMQPRLKPNVCLRCTDLMDLMVCPTTYFMHGILNIWKLIEMDCTRLMELKLRFTAFLEFAKAARKADQVYLLNAQHKYTWFDRSDEGNTEFVEGVIGLLSFADRTDSYGKMTFYRYRRCNIGARVDKLLDNMKGLPTHHAMLLKFST